MDNLYKYWFFMIKPEYGKKIPLKCYSKTRSVLFAYTDKKSLAKLFLKFHKKKAFIIIKKNISRDMVNELTKYYQNSIIRKTQLTTKDSNYNIVNITIALTENEYIMAENICYSSIDYIYKLAWDSNLHLKTIYKSSLDILGYSQIHKSLVDGESAVLPTTIQEDIYGSLIDIFGYIMEVSI